VKTKDWNHQFLFGRLPNQLKARWSGSPGLWTTVRNRWPDLSNSDLKFPGDERRMAEQKATNVTWHAHNITREDRQKLNGHRGAVLWFTGLSGCGKSTIANAVDQILHERGVHTFVLDGDNIRMGLNKNLGFTPEDRTENIRRIGEVAKLFADAATIVSTAFISPYKADRDLVRGLMPLENSSRLWSKPVLRPANPATQRSVQEGSRRRNQELHGISAPYEAPEKPELDAGFGQQGH
jgi:adenylylsulfate kinase